jgi:hypothetical protein
VVVVEGDAADAAVFGEGAGLGFDLLGGEDAVDQGQQGSRVRSSR